PDLRRSSTPWSCIGWNAVLARGAKRQLEMKPLFFLEVLNDLEEVTGLRVAARTEHSHQAFRRPFRSTAQLLESIRRDDVIANDRMSVIEIPGEKAFDSFPQQLLPVFPIGSETCLHRFLELPRQRHFTSPAFSASCSRPVAPRRSQSRGPASGSDNGTW